MNDFITTLLPYLTELVVVVAGSTTTFLVKEAFKLIKNKNQYTIARGIYFIVEQLFQGQAAVEKRFQFDSMLMSKLPGLKQSEIDHLRESICGEINSGFKTIKGSIGYTEENLSSDVLEALIHKSEE